MVCRKTNMFCDNCQELVEGGLDNLEGMRARGVDASGFLGYLLSMCCC